MDSNLPNNGTLDLAAIEPTTIGPYKIVREIGRGMMGAVYQAEHENLQRKVAVKVLPANLAFVAGRLDRFRREMQAIGRLDHPNIVRATDAGESDGVFFLAMELVDGPDVARVLARNGRLDSHTACEIARQAALGLQHIHENELVHRDLKPSNLVLSSEGTVKILDLGIAMLRQSDRDSTLTAADTLMGTPDFMAPEQIDECRNVDIRADIYSLGCTLYMLLSGQVPFPDAENHVAKFMAHSQQQPTPIETLVPSVPKPLANIVRKMMAKSPQDRYQQPQEVAEALAPLADASCLRELAGGSKRQSGAPVAAARGNTASVSHHISRKTWVALLVGTAAVLLAAATLAPRGPSADPNHSDEPLVLVSSEPVSLVPHDAQMDVPRHNEDEVATSSTHTNTLDLADTARTIDAKAQQLVNTTKSIDENTERIADTIDALRAAFEAIPSQSTPVEAPKSPGDFYHNARVYEQKGNYHEARQNYLELFRFELQVVDPHHRFQQFLKLQEGLHGALEVYQGLPGDSASTIRRYAVALLQVPDVRREQLRQLVDEEPHFAPAVYQLSREYSLARLGQQSLADMKTERHLLEQFLALHQAGHVLRHFLDQSDAAKMIDDAEQRLAALESKNEAALGNPVRFTFRYNEPRWHVTFQIAEPATEVFFREGPDQEFKSTGSMGVVHATTGKPMPNLWTTLASRESCVLELKYTDTNGEIQGPFRYDFDPAGERFRSARQMLDTLPEQNWVSFGVGRNRDHLYFTPLYPWRAAIKEVRFGIDQDEPAQIRLLPENLSGQNATQLAMKVPKDTKFVVVQLVYHDGTTSEVVRVQR